jgi:gamma-glutamyltranspeptidase / glutathione hydrolase
MGQTVSALSPNFSLRRSVRKDAVRSRGGIVVTQNRAASEVGARVLAEGGHAVDAAVAAAFVIGVVEPWMSGIGGIGALLVHEADRGKTTGIDFGPRSPKALDAKDFVVTDQRDESNLFGWPMVVGNVNTVGPKAVVAPTMPAGLAAVHRRFGRRAWRDLVMPAADIAEAGPVVDWYTTLLVATAMADLARDPGTQARFLPGGLPPFAPAAVESKPVVRLPMPDLARTLRAIAADGAEVLYTGALARSIADDIKAMGGYLSTDDLAAVRAREVEPLAIAYGGRTIEVLPELNGGPTLAVAFDALGKVRGKIGAGPDAATFVAYAEALRAGWRQRFERMGDAGDRTAPTCTTHICVVDRAGNMVTLTQTLLTMFGARIVLPTSGILMNNGMNWFDPIPGRPNSIAPDRAALANYAPAVMTGGGETIAIGGCGGRRIISAVFQLLAMCAEFGFDLDRAFHEPRIDVSGLEPVVADRRMPPAIIETLASRFATVVAEPVEHPYPFTIAGAVRRREGMNEGAAEPQHPWPEAVAEA